MKPPPPGPPTTYQLVTDDFIRAASKPRPGSLEKRERGRERYVIITGRGKSEARGRVNFSTGSRRCHKPNRSFKTGQTRQASESLTHCRSKQQGSQSTQPSVPVQYGNWADSAEMHIMETCRTHRLPTESTTEERKLGHKVVREQHRSTLERRGGVGGQERRTGARYA